MKNFKFNAITALIVGLNMAAVNAADGPILNNGLDNTATGQNVIVIGHKSVVLHLSALIQQQMVLMP